MSLFEAKDILRQPQQAEAIRNYATPKSDNAVTQAVPVTDHYVLDGGWLLHRLIWMEGCTYSSIADEYASFTVKHYARATVVFDGYEVGPSIKDCTHQRRSRNLNANKVNITGANKICWKKGGLLVEWGKQASNYPAHHGTFATERLRSDSSWGRCLLSNLPPSLEKTRISLYSCSTMLW